MKTKLGITIFLLLLSFAFVPPFILKASVQSTILADIINSSASAVNYANDIWINRESLTHMGIILGKLATSDYDAEAQYLANVSDWVDLVGLLRIAEIDGYTSATLQSLGTQALNAHPMVGVLPANWQGLYLNYYRDELHIYAYANQWGVSKWNLQDAYNAFAAYYQACSTFPWSIGSGQVTQQDDRHYDGGAQTLDAFLEFDEMGVPGALAQADNVWNKINSYSWPGYYPYHLGSSGTECEIGFSMIAGDYASRKGAAMTYADRLITDINYKLLANGWLSADWAPGGYVFCHAGQNTEHRLPSTQDGIMVLQAYYPQFTNAMKTSFQQLLQGYGGYLPAWQGLLSTDLAEQNSAGVNLFRPDSLNSWSTPRITDSGTALACQVMFLEGIIPVTGSLNIPKRDEIYEDVCSAMSAKDFLFDYANHRIRIPVLAGQIKFQFGTGIASYTFPTSDTYTVQFSSDWNSVISARAGEHRTWIVDDDGPADFHTIQEAINTASDGDTVFVRNGTYYENLVVNKTLSLVGENRQSSIVDGRNNGYVVDVTAENVSISQFTLQNSGSSWSGVNVESSGTVIQDNLMIDNHGGVWVRPGSLNTTISGNNIFNKQPSYADGIRLWSSGTLVVGNTITNESSAIGVDAPGNTIEDNLIANNSVGIRNSLGSLFFHNSLVNNGLQATAGGNNSWDNGYPYGGNYWSDYNGSDAYSGVYQNETGSDGIGDTQYLIDANNVDHYPLMNPGSWVFITIPGDLNGDKTVNIYDSIILANHFGFDQHNPAWDPNVDLKEDGIIDLFDAIVLANNFGKSWT